MVRNNEIRTEDDISLHKKYGNLIVVSGFAGSGKGTVLKELFKLADYKYSISATTRAPRAGEAHGVDYYFLSGEEFRAKIDGEELLEYVEYSGNYYGTLRKPVEDMLKVGYNVVLEIEVKGALNVKEKFPQALMVFITPPTYEELEKRLRNRGTESEESLKKRLEISKTEINYISLYDCFIINGDGKQREAAEIIDKFVNNFKGGKSAHGISEEDAEKFIRKYFAAE